MIINSNSIAVLQKECSIPAIQDRWENGWDICCDLAAEDISNILHPDYLFGNEYPEMLIDREKTTYHLYCFHYDKQPEWALRAILYPMELTDEKKLELLDEAYTSETMDIVYGMIMVTEDMAGDCDSVYFNLTMTPEEQKFIFDLVGIDQYEQDYILRLQNL